MTRAKTKIPEIQLYAIQAFGKKDTRLRKQVVEEIAQQFSLARVSADNHVSRLKTSGYIKNLPQKGNNNQGVEIQLTALGRKVRDNPATMLPNPIPDPPPRRHPPPRPLP